jgi:hypothetical protein
VANQARPREDFITGNTSAAQGAPHWVCFHLHCIVTSTSKQHHEHQRGKPLAFSSSSQRQIGETLSRARDLLAEGLSAESKWRRRKVASRRVICSGGGSGNLW